MPKTRGYDSGGYVRKSVWLAASLWSSLIAPAFAQDAKTLEATVIENKAATSGFAATVCSRGKNKRVVSLSSTDSQRKVPCEVHYRKETEQPRHDQVLFKAEHDLAYCETKAQAFVEKLSGMGWSCSRM